MKTFGWILFLGCVLAVFIAFPLLLIIPIGYVALLIIGSTN